MRSLLLALVFSLVVSLAPAATRAAETPTPTPAPSATAEFVQIDRTRPIQVIRPLFALGSTVDKEPAGSIPSLYSKRNVRQMLAAGLGWLSYRLFTELSVQDWHWNPAGTFSEGTQGYWVSGDHISNALISDSFGYRLPHRGFTTDQGNNEDYSRLDDGNPKTYWKSDPYLTRRFTGDPDGQHPQWVVVDLGQPRPVNAVRIDWSNPYATNYRIEYWTGDDAINNPGVGDWQTFPSGLVANGRGGTALSQFGKVSIPARFVRVLMTGSSNTCDSHGSSDGRNCVGYAMNEIFIGNVTRTGRFSDYVHHAPCGGANPQKYACGWRQTATYVSSVDPWHTSANRVKNQEQPGLDLIARSGLTREIGAMYPVPMLYSTPQNAVNEIRYLKARDYPVAFIELGEEPDGQYTQPEDYAALYVQWAKAIHAIYPALKLGGPVFSGVNSELQTWSDAQGNISWLNRFLNYLRSHGQMQQLAFMSFEHYPFGGCDRGAVLQQDLLQEPSIMKGIVNQWRSDGLPTNVPIYISEANFSAVNFTQVPMQIEGALWQADYMASALANGVSGAVYYQYEPVPLTQNADCPSDWGNLTMFVADGHAHIRALGAQFFAAQMLAEKWLAPSRATFTLYSTTTNIQRGGYALVTAYAAKRAESNWDEWSVLLINKDVQAHTVDLRFVSPQQPGSETFVNDVIQVTFGSRQYVWRSRGSRSVPAPDEGPMSATITAPTFRPCLVRWQAPNSETLFTLPAQSLTVLRGRIPGDLRSCG